MLHINKISILKFAYVNRFLYLCIVKPCKSYMYKPSSNSRQASLFWDLETMLDSKHPLFKLANMVDWSLFEKSFAPLFCADNGRPPKPIRLMTGLLMYSTTLGILFFYHSSFLTATLLSFFSTSLLHE